MKTMKLALVLAFVSFAAMTFAAEQPSPKPVTVKMSLQKALNHKGMAWEMMKHLSPDFLAVEKPGHYSIEFRYGHHMYVIYGKYEEWISFFNLMKWRRVKPANGSRGL